MRNCVSTHPSSKFHFAAVIAASGIGLFAAPASAQKIMNNVKVTVKSFLGKIGSNTGYFGAYGNVERIATAALVVFAKATDLGFSENPTTDRFDKAYRAVSEMKFAVACDGNKVKQMTATPLATDTGKEGPLQAPAGVTWGVSSKQTGTTATFQWAVKAMPHAYTLPAFNAIKSRTSIWVWHTIGGRISCPAGRAKVDFNLTGSKFPTHRVFVDGVERKTMTQGPFSNLWRASRYDRTMVE